MANPMPNEQELYEELKRAGVKLDPRLWQIFSHHLGNDIQVIYLSVKCLSDLPPWLSYVYRAVVRIQRPFKRRGISEDIPTVCAEALQRVDSINGLMKRFKAIARENEGDNNFQ
jgi:hypothetical protein